MSSSPADRRARGAAAATAPLPARRFSATASATAFRPAGFPAICLLAAVCLLAPGAPRPTLAQSADEIIVISPLAPSGSDAAAEEASAGSLLGGNGGQPLRDGAGAPGAPQPLLPLNAPSLNDGGTFGSGLDGSLEDGSLERGLDGNGGFTPTGASPFPGTLGSAPTNLQSDTAGELRYQPQGDPEGLGVLGPNEGGFGRRVWAGTDRRVLEALLPRLPANNPSPVLFELARRLLLTDAVMPSPSMASKGLGSSDLMKVRLERLAALGEPAGLARVLAVLPDGAQPELRRRLEVELLLTRGRESDACQSVRAGAPEDGEDRFWLKALTYCQILSGERAAAELGLTILRESARSDDQLFLRLAEAALTLKAQAADVPARIKALLDERKALANEVAQLRRELAMSGGGKAAAPEARDVAGVTFVAQVLSGVSGKDLPALIDEHKDRLGSGAVLLIADTGGKAAVAAGVTQDLTERLSAVDLVRAAVERLGGKGGGGRPDMAQGGGADASRADEAIKAAEAVLGG